MASLLFTARDRRAVERFSASVSEMADGATVKECARYPQLVFTCLAAFLYKVSFDLSDPTSLRHSQVSMHFVYVIPGNWRMFGRICWRSVGSSD
ncbi:hypothetical protein COO20_11960 [Thalassospira marina]|uniref:Uncharacterized protein n=1 Tax=Thalassospira marina TaxID=2048283 RepID=A0A2N3KT25_9PROT|nr:hypothetical protein COO20_11960 [Thalassospira marina]